MAAAAGLVAAVAAALGALLMAPGLSQPDGLGAPGPRGGAAAVAAERRRSGRMDQALLLVRNELPAPGLNLAARSDSCHQVRGCAGRGSPPASASDSPASGGAARLLRRLPEASSGRFASVLPSSSTQGIPAAGDAPAPWHLSLSVPLSKAEPCFTLVWH